MVATAEFRRDVNIMLLNVACVALVIVCAILLVVLALQRHRIRSYRRSHGGTGYGDGSFTESQFVNVAHQAGLAELNESILKNLYHILNSLNVSSSMAVERAERLEVKSLVKLAGMIREHQDDLSHFLTEDERGKRLPEALIQYAEFLKNAHASLVKEIRDLSLTVGKLYQIVKAQQAYAEVESATEDVDVRRLMDDALTMEAKFIEDHRIGLVTDYPQKLMVHLPKIKLLHVLVTLIKNGCETMVMLDDKGPWALTLRAMSASNHRVLIEIGDERAVATGEVFDPISSPSESTTLTRRHFSLYYCANAISEMQGTFTIFAENPGHGAFMRLELPGVAPGMQEATA